MIVPTELQSIVEDTAQSVRKVLGDDEETTRLIEIAREASKQSWGLVYGLLRGRVPSPVPFDLQSVAMTLATRLTVQLDASDDVTLRHGQPEVQSMIRPTSPSAGLSVLEWMTVNRYRRRSA